MEPQFAKAAWWTYILQKTEHTDRRSQRGQCGDKYQHQGDPNQHQPSSQTASPVSRATDNLQQQQRGQRQQQQQHLIHPNREPAVSWHLAFAAEWRH